MAIIISTAGKNARVVEESGLQNEDELQKYISDNPESLPVHDIKPNAKLLVVGREFPTTSGPIDVLAIDAEGEIYVVETKLFKNADKRLVVAQVLDYGAALWRRYGDATVFVTEVDRQIQQHRKTGLVECLCATFALDPDSADAAIENMKVNLQSGNIHFIVLMNRMHDALKDLILFLNQHSGFSIYAVEMEFYRHDGMEIVIPKLFGTEAVKPGGGGSSRGKWDENAFFNHASTQVDQTTLAAMRKLYDYANSNGKIVWGKGKSEGRFSARFPGYDDEGVYYLSTDGVLRTVALPLPRHDAAAKRLLSLRQDALKNVGFDVSKRGGWDDCCDYNPEQWVPRVDRYMDVIAKLRNGTERSTGM